MKICKYITNCHPVLLIQLLSRCTCPPWWRRGYRGLATAFGSRACQTTSESEYPLDIGAAHSCTVSSYWNHLFVIFSRLQEIFISFFFLKKWSVFVEMSDFREENCFNRNYNAHLWILDWSHLFFGYCKWSQNSRNTVSSNIDAESVGKN